MTPARRRHRSLPLAAVVLLLTLVATACPLTKAGRRCSGSGWARDNAYVLQCRKGRWVRAMTFGDYLRFVDAANRQARAEAERRASSEVRAAQMRGTSAWVDVYDWSPTFVASRSAGAVPTFTLSRIDRMADAGISTLYIQTAKAELADPVLDPTLLASIVAKAKGRGMRVVGWYLPTLTDVGADQAHLAATSQLGLDGIGVDIESRAVVDVPTRNQRLVDLSAWLRATYPGMPLAAIVLPPVVTEIINPAYWPQFPWSSIATSYDVWMPMAYWTNRTTASGWRDGYRYTLENIDRVRADLGNPGATVHPIGGLSDTATDAEIGGFVQASLERGAIGGGLYDDSISTTAQYAQLAPLARP
ncbi:MAG: hypothetical protein U0Q22_03235 [Acidimicrobiales bacterium]